jgi:hypothetical protein
MAMKKRTVLIRFLDKINNGTFKSARYFRDKGNQVLHFDLNFVFDLFIRSVMFLSCCISEFLDIVSVGDFSIQRV